MAASVGILCVIISKTSRQEKKDSNRCIIYVCVTCVVFFFVSESSGQHKTKGKPINQWVLFFWQKQERCP